VVLNRRISTILMAMALCVAGNAIAAAPAYAPGNYDKSGDIFDALYGFRTHDGRPLQTFLRSYGLGVVSVEVDTVEQLGPQDGDMPGDVVYTIIVKGVPAKPIPCDVISSPQSLETLKGDGLPLEFVRRRGKFPLAIEAGDHPTDAMIFWIATGRCSKSY